MNKIAEKNAEIRLLRQVIAQMEKKLGEKEKELETVYKSNKHLLKINTELLATMHTDALTGLQNRRKFEEFFAQEYKRAKRYNQAFSLIILDIDNFKIVNDTFGHQQGDEVLKVVSSTIRKKLRDSDFGARWGGEEFIIILPNTDALSAATQVAERIRAEIEAHDFGNFKITISSGIAQFANGVAAEALIKAADDALYTSKRSGKNKITIK